MVRWPGFTKPVIMKVNTGDGAVLTTIREAAILEDLQGRRGAPHLISVIPELGMMVMEDCGRSTLLKMIKKPPIILSDAEWLQILKLVAIRLNEVHCAGYVHTDLDAGKFMIRLDRNQWSDVHLIDYGLSMPSGGRHRH